MADGAELARVREKVGITTPYMLYIGTIQPRKNLVRLVRAFEESAVPLQLVLAGKMGWRSQPILDEIRAVSEATRDRILLPGFVSNSDKAALISGATTLLYPSLYEGFGFPLLEAQACGTAVLSSDSSSLPEIAGDSALLVDPTDTAALAAAIRRLASDSDLRGQLVQRGFENVKRFTWHDAASQLLNTLEKAITH